MKKRTKLRGVTAADLMTSNPMSISAGASVQEAVTFLTDKGFSAAPVIDAAGRPIGVLSRSDIVVHDRETVNYLPAAHDYYERGHGPVAPSGEVLKEGFEVVDVDRTQVRDIMTPAVFSVALDTPALELMQTMVDLRVHRLFVIGEGGILLGVISALDVLGYLCREKHAAELLVV